MNPDDITVFIVIRRTIKEKPKAPTFRELLYFIDKTSLRTVSNIVARLEEKGFIKRNKKNGRVELGLNAENFDSIYGQDGVMTADLKRDLFQKEFNELLDKYGADAVLNENNFLVECSICKQILKNWVGSTPCCGAVAYLIKDKKTNKIAEIENDLIYKSGNVFWINEREELNTPISIDDLMSTLEKEKKEGATHYFAQKNTAGDFCFRPCLYKPKNK